MILIPSVSNLPKYSLINSSLVVVCEILHDCCCLDFWFPFPDFAMSKRKEKVVEIDSEDELDFLPNMLKETVFNL